MKSEHKDTYRYKLSPLLAYYYQCFINRHSLECEIEVIDSGQHNGLVDYWYHFEEEERQEIREYLCELNDIYERFESSREACLLIRVFDILFDEYRKANNPNEIQDIRDRVRELEDRLHELNL